MTDTNTGVAVITVCNGDNSIILDAGANNLVSKEIIDKNKDVILAADAVIMQLEIPMETVVYAAKIAHKAGVKVILNPAPIAELPLELLENTDVFILNETEAEFELGAVNIFLSSFALHVVDFAVSQWSNAVLVESSDNFTVFVDHFHCSDTCWQ